MGEEGNVESKSYKVENNKENAFSQNYPNNNNSSNNNNNNNKGLRQRGILKLDNLADSTAYWAALTTITQVSQKLNSLGFRIIIIQEGRTEHEKKFYFGTLGAGQNILFFHIICAKK